MAVDDIQYRETDSLILPSKTFFPLSIHVAHYQLRHYISSFEQDLIYYAAQDHVFCLNVETKHRKHIATLPFESRCTAAGHGWICVGGENEGQFAAIKLDGTSNAMHNEVDSSLPLNLGSPSQSRRPGSPSKPKIHLERVGREIVNSISIHKIPGECPQSEDDIVAVLTNNDKSVRIYSLTRSVQVFELQCPFAMNHATISPDGNLLLAVGDENKAFVYERKRNKASKASGKSVQTDSDHMPFWNILAIVPLHCPPTRDEIGYFTTAWSPSGSLCAVGSECGHITVMDTELLVKSDYAEDAIVQVIKSTRPDVGNGPGSVRAMLFTQQPWDLLIWSEDQGRVCASDLRAGLMSRQIMSLDPTEDGIQTSEIIETADERDSESQGLQDDTEYPRRYRRRMDSDNNVALHWTPERRASLQTRPINPENDLNPLSPQEQQILEAIRVTRERNPGPERAVAPRSIHYHLPGFTSQRAHGDGAESNQEPSTSRDADSRNNGLTWTSISLLRESLRDRYSDPERRLTQPNRQPPPVATNDDSTASEADTSTSPRQGLPPAPLSRVERSGSPNSYGWPLIEAAMMDRARDYSSRPWGESATAAEARRFRQLARERERVREQSGLSRYTSRRGVGAAHDPLHGVRTAGLAMSQDGRKIYVGAETGVYVFSIDTMARKMFPAITPR